MSQTAFYYWLVFDQIPVCVLTPENYRKLTRICQIQPYRFLYIARYNQIRPKHSCNLGHGHINAFFDSRGENRCRLPTVYDDIKIHQDDSFTAMKPEIVDDKEFEMATGIGFQEAKECFTVITAVNHRFRENSRYILLKCPK